MITISNLRIEDIDDTQDKAMLSRSYDAFLLIPLYIAMSYKQDLHICGKVSKRLYHNIMSYVQTILCDFSDKLSRVNVIVDGFNDERDSNKGGGDYRHKLFVWDRLA